MNRKEDDMSGTEIARRVAQEFVRENELVPLSILSMDYDPPVGGWETLGVEVVEDDLLRPAIRREDARKIVQERREQELRDAPHPAEVPASLVAVGVPAIDGGTPVEALTSRDPAYKTPAEEFGGRPKPNFLEEELAAGARQLAAAKAEAERKMRRVLEGRDK